MLPWKGADVNLVTGRLLRKGDYLFGSYVKPEVVDGYINGVNPGDRADVLGRFPFSESSVDVAVESAAVGYRVWRRLGINDRAAAVHRFRAELVEHQESMAQLLTREVGKPLWESRQELMATIRAIDLLLDDGVNILAPRVIDDIGARSDRLPRGIVAIFCPYNFPVLVAVVQTATAVLAGNAVIVKPSKFTPGLGQAHIDLWDGCGLPRGTINMIQGPGSVVGHRLATHPDLDVLLFTGALETAGTITRLTADRPELPKLIQCGGKGTAIVVDDVELDRAVYEVMVGAFLSAGQRHNSTGRVIVVEDIYDEFVARLVSRSKRLKVGYGFDAQVFMGPLISENLRTRYRRFARSMAGQGHPLLLPPEQPEDVGKGFYVKPAIIGVDWARGTPVLEGEPPGPTLLVYKVADWSQAVALHNQVEARISTSLFIDQDNPILDEFKERLRTGALNINRGTIGASLRLPSVGLGTSSNGVGGGVNLLHQVTHPRSQLTETRGFQSLPKLPGVCWDDTDESADGVELPVQDDPTEVGDLSSFLEASE
jgi:succinylglutamic semialdehyde dehydrogenase